FGEEIGFTGESEKHKFTTYERDGALDYAVNRQYHSQHGRFNQVDPLGMGAASLADPQSLNLYSYVLNDPVNFTDPLGLYEACVHEAMTEFLAKLAGFSDADAARLGTFTGDGPGGADSKEFAATTRKNMANWVFHGKGTIPDIHFASEQRLSRMKASFQYH